MSTHAAAPPAYRLPQPVRRVLAAVAGLAVLALAFLAAFSAIDLAARHTVVQRASYTDVRTLQIDNADDIRLTGAPAGTPMRVTTRITEGLRSPQHLVRRHGGGTLALSSHCHIVFGGSCNVRYDIAVPNGTGVTARSSAGDIAAEELQASGRLTLHSSAGDVTAARLSAPSLRISSSAGDVHASALRIADLDARSSAGDVTIGLATPARRLLAHSSAGDVDLTMPDATYRVDARSSAGGVDDRGIRTDPAAPRWITATSSAGDVRIGLP